MRTPPADDLVLGIDLGTSYFKVGLFDARGELRGLWRVPTPAESPVPGYCEVAPDAFWEALARGLREAFSSAGAGSDKVRGVSYSSQANSFLLQDDRARPLTPLIIWPDVRTDRVCEEMGALRKHPESGVWLLTRFMN